MQDIRHPWQHTLRQAQNLWSESTDSLIQAGAGAYRRITDFLAREPQAFERKCGEGHMTGSAFIVDPHREQIVLLHHGKLDRWLQPGGHADGDRDIAAVALREARKETGLPTLVLADPLTLAPAEAPPLPFDADVHEIPARGTVAAHLHHDLRYLVFGDARESPLVSHESREVRWVPLAAVSDLTQEESIHRMIAKWRTLVAQTASDNWS